MSADKNYTYMDAFADIDKYISQFKAGEERIPVLYLANYQSVQGLQIIELNKLTLLFGPNSSGKSVIVDALNDLVAVLEGREIPKKNRNWHMNREFSVFYDQMPVTVIGIGGLKHARYANSQPGNMEFVNEEENYIKLSEIFHRGAGDIVICQSYDVASPNWNLFYWNNNKHVARFSQHSAPVIYSPEGAFREFVNEAEDWHQWEGHFSDNPKKNIGYHENIKWLFRSEDEIDSNDWDFDGIQREIEKDEFGDDFACPYKFIGNKHFDWTEKLDIGVPSIAEIYDSPYGTLMHYFLMGIVNAVRNMLVNSSSLGPLRSIPTEDDLHYNNVIRYQQPSTEQNSSLLTGSVQNEAEQAVRKIFADMLGVKSPSIGILLPHDGKSYWHYLARDAANARLQNLSSELLVSINSWLSDKFDAEYRIKAEIEVNVSPVLIEEFEAETDPKNLHSNLNVRLYLEDRTTKNKTYPDAVGVGISQLVPVLIGILYEERLYIEQPELHLHPKLQLVVSDVAISRLNKMRGHDNCWLLAETHSEHMILRFLRRIAESGADIKHRDYWLAKEEITVYYVKNDGEGAVFHKLRITDDGDFKDDWPDGFFEDRDSELFY